MTPGTLLRTTGSLVDRDNAQRNSITEQGIEITGTALFIK